ncbi:hypothetical protein D3OALGA1CA_800 [Olavius algarvensis associated proteobacterium Delta 3]|nr:hypothetical protein D3OALGA1CA_800 [Olavius algarvensis associated proteobacterium Delta 3]CAB5142365.1 hypothetical protein D3OALGB2SA_4304 [Olavius algarvensis associated proteobacterium Delta 3]
MISRSFRFEDFIDAVQGKNDSDIICMADQEALHAWRSAHRSKGLPDNLMDKSREYQDKLIGLIDFLRHGLCARSGSDSDIALFQKIREDARSTHTIH